MKHLGSLVRSGVSVVQGCLYFGLPACSGNAGASFQDEIAMMVNEKSLVFRKPFCRCCGLKLTSHNLARSLGNSSLSTLAALVFLLNSPKILSIPVYWCIRSYM